MFHVVLVIAQGHGLKASSLVVWLLLLNIVRLLLLINVRLLEALVKLPRDLELVVLR